MQLSRSLQRQNSEGMLTCLRNTQGRRKERRKVNKETNKQHIQQRNDTKTNQQQHILILDYKHSKTIWQCFDNNQRTNQFIQRSTTHHKHNWKWRYMLAIHHSTWHDVMSFQAWHQRAWYDMIWYYMIASWFVCCALDVHASVCTHGLTFYKKMMTWSKQIIKQHNTCGTRRNQQINKRTSSYTHRYNAQASQDNIHVPYLHTYLTFYRNVKSEDQGWTIQTHENRNVRMQMHRIITTDACT